MVRRQKLKEKLNALQEMIPNCNKRDKASTLDDAIKYINSLHYQVQMMSLGVGYSMFHSSSSMMPQTGQQGMPTQCLASIVQTDPLRGETEIGMGMSGMFPSLNFPMSQLGLPNPHSLTSLATPGLPPLGGIPASRPGNFLSTTYGFQSIIEGENGPVKGASSSKKELCPIIPVISEKLTKGESTTIVLPSKRIPPCPHKDVKAQGSSHSGCGESKYRNIAGLAVHLQDDKTTLS